MILLSEACPKWAYIIIDVNYEADYYISLIAEEDVPPSDTLY